MFQNDRSFIDFFEKSVHDFCVLDILRCFLVKLRIGRFTSTACSSGCISCRYRAWQDSGQTVYYFTLSVLEGGSWLLSHHTCNTEQKTGVTLSHGMHPKLYAISWVLTETQFSVFKKATVKFGENDIIWGMILNLIYSVLKLHHSQI